MGVEYDVIMMWCIFSFTWIARMSWSCWTTWWCYWCLYMLCAYMLLVNFLTCYWCWILVKACTLIAVEKYGECMHSWLSHMFTQYTLSQMFTSILPLTGYLYPYSR